MVVHIISVCSSDAKRILDHFSICNDWQGRSVVVVDAEAQWNIYSPNFVLGAYYPTFAIFSMTGIVPLYEDLVIKVQPSAYCIQDGL